MGMSDKVAPNIDLTNVAECPLSPAQIKATNILIVGHTSHIAICNVNSIIIERSDSD